MNRIVKAAAQRVPGLEPTTIAKAIAGDAYGGTLWRDHCLQENKIIEK